MVVNIYKLLRNFDLDGSIVDLSSKWLRNLDQI